MRPEGAIGMPAVFLAKPTSAAAGIAFSERSRSGMDRRFCNFELKLETELN